MKISEHADRTEKITGIRAVDIHKWIDDFFDYESFDNFLRSGNHSGYDPYNHRKYRHSQEALEDAYHEFGNKYTKEQIKAVFESHIRDDYSGYFPHKEDFENGTFKEKYHEDDDRIIEETILSKSEISDYFKGKQYSHETPISKKHSTGFLLRIVIPTFLAIILFVSSVFTIIIPLFRNNMMNGKKEMIMELTSSAVSIIDYYIELEAQGTLTREEAQSEAASEINKMRYGTSNKDYFWITDMHPKMIMHPYRIDLIGQDLTNYKDIENKSGIKLFSEFVKIVKKDNHGFLEYLWQWMDDTSRTGPKLSYVRGIENWNWIIGTGIYINDVEEEIDKLIQKLLIIFAIISSGLIFIMLNIVYQSRRIEDNRLRAETGLREAKDRYRALVEASKEGYILEVNGENIYSNKALQQMLGYTEKEFAALKIWNIIPTDNNKDKKVIDYLQNIYSHQTSKSKEFETSVSTKNGTILNVILSVGNIFFSQKNGHIISIREITRVESNLTLDSYIDYQTKGKDEFTFTKIDKIFRQGKPENISDNPDLYIDKDALVFAAVAKLKRTNADELYVVDNKNYIIGTLNYYDISLFNAGLPAKIIIEIDNSENPGHVVNALNRVPQLIRNMMKQGADTHSLRTTIGKIYNAAIERFIHITINEMGKPPAPFAFLSLGSNARHEMTMFSDQDNALVFLENGQNDSKETKEYFAKLSTEVCTKLNLAGYPFCPGGIMASNPKWRLSMNEWKKQFEEWILDTNPEKIMEVGVFLDIHCVYGNVNLVNELKQYIMTLIEKEPQFLVHFAKNSLSYTAPLNLFGQIKAEKLDGVKIFNIKNSIRPIENFAKIYAIKNNINECNTLKRLKLLQEQGILHDETYNDMISVFDYLWNLRFYNQIICHADLRSVEDELDLETISDKEKSNLQNILSNITVFQTKLSYDFLGMALQ